MFKLLKKLIQETRNKLNSVELFGVDRKLMILLGFWPAKFNNKKSIVTFCILFLFDFLPKVNYFSKQFLDLEPQFIAVSCSEVVVIFLSTLSILNFIYYRKTMELLIEKLNINWFKITPIENPEWHKVRTHTAMSSNRIAFSVRCVFYACTIIYCVVPYGIFFVKYYFLKMNVEKVTSTFVE